MCGTIELFNAQMQVPSHDLFVFTHVHVCVYVCVCVRIHMHAFVLCACCVHAHDDLHLYASGPLGGYSV